MSLHSEYEVSVLGNGVRIATATMPHLRGVCVGIWAAVGGRHEAAGECGLAHFLEHLLFKGTSKRSARELTTAVEGVGGYLNAFTTEDHTCYYAKAAAGHFGRLSDVLIEMYADSQFPENEVEREREVIGEEILSYKDVPSQWAEELLSSALWPRHPLGRPLTGTAETVARLGRPELKGFRDRYYTGANTIFTVAGPISHKEVLERVSGPLSRIPRGRKAKAVAAPASTKSVLLVEQEDTEQAHLALGFHAMSRNDDLRYALRLLSVVLGENMSSRLFQTLRERYGYCYSVQSSTVLLEETGALSIFADLDAAKLPLAMKAIRRELDRLREVKVSKAELKRAQDFTIGQTEIALDSATQQISWMAESLMSHGRVVSPGEVERALLSVRPEDLLGVSNLCFKAERTGVALVGPGYGSQAVKRMVFE
ncbi:MAG: pitrilysin family protein [Verrucomicrobiota bacterium]